MDAACGVVTKTLFDAPAAPVRVEACAESAVERHLVVLASSSSGNCSALIHGEGGTRRVTLIDAGLSPRRTNRLLGELGLSLDHVDDVVFTHLDTDHCHVGWAAGMPRHATLHVHERHVKRGMRSGLLVRRTEVFGGGFALRCGARAEVVMNSHDDLGTAAFRFSFEGTGETLGYATDVGHVHGGLIETLRGVSVLAIESNYCPAMQENSARPRFLKDRIVGGGGHLSNKESAAAVRAIGVRKHVVLLHLSRECNTKEAALAEHAHAGVGVSVAEAGGPIGAVRVG
ncbi:MAG: MBL fold metallo-hydrolase [Planctomycetes bacterium]|nr:MBL fold metallo-hydrolase [Planctomycetota bacterium]